MKTLLEKNKFSIVDISPVIIRLPIFMRGNDEVPLVSKKLESIALRIFGIFSENFSKKSTYVSFFFSESYMIHAVKSMVTQHEAQ